MDKIQGFIEIHSLRFSLMITPIQRGLSNPVAFDSAERQAPNRRVAFAV